MRWVLGWDLGELSLALIIRGMWKRRVLRSCGGVIG